VSGPLDQRTATSGEALTDGMIGVGTAVPPENGLIEFSCASRTRIFEP